MKKRNGLISLNALSVVLLLSSIVIACQDSYNESFSSAENPITTLASRNVFVTSNTIDEIHGDPYTVRSIEAIFDIEKMLKDGKIRTKKETKTTVSYITADTGEIFIHEKNKKLSAGAGLPFSKIILSGDVLNAQNQSRYESSKSRYGQIVIRVTTETQYLQSLSPIALLPYVNEEFKQAITKMNEVQILTCFGSSIYSSMDKGMVIIATIVSDKTNTGSLSSYTDQISAAASIISANIGLNAGKTNSTTKRYDEVKENSSFQYKILGGEAPIKIYLELEELIEDIPYLLSTLTDQNSAIIGSSTYSAIPLHDIINHIDQKVAHNIFREYVQQLINKTGELEQVFGDNTWIQTTKFDSPGLYYVNAGKQNDIVVLGLGGSSSGPAGDHTYEYTKGFLGLEIGRKTTAGEHGQPGSALWMQMESKDMERIAIKIGSPGVKGGNRTTTSQNASGYPGGDSESSYVTIEKKDGSNFTFTVNGSAGGLKEWISTPVIMPEVFPSEVISFYSALGKGTTGAILNNTKLGADSSGKSGTAFVQYYRWN